MEMPGIEPGAFYMQSERATTALHPLFMRNELLKKMLYLYGIDPPAIFLILIRMTR